jgi:hypothetical protein
MPYGESQNRKPLECPTPDGSQARSNNIVWLADSAWVSIRRASAARARRAAEHGSFSGKGKNAMESGELKSSCARTGWMRPAIVLVLALVIGIAIGFAAGWFLRGRSTPELVSQEGTVTLFDGEEKDVFYPRPYANPPALDIDTSIGSLTLTEQRANGFKIRAKPGNTVQNRPWRAKGVLAN